MFKGQSLCVVGNINRDVKTSSLPAGEYLFQDGETSVGTIDETVGGGGANSACIAALLGARTAFLGKIGDDDLGRRLSKTLTTAGVSAKLAVDGQTCTGTSINLAFDSGHRHFLSFLPNNSALRFEDLQLESLSEYRHLLRSDIWFSEPMLFGGNQKLFQAARTLGIKVSIDLNWDPQWTRKSPLEIQQRKVAVRGVLPWVDLAHGNISELNGFAETSDINLTVKRLLDWGAKAVVVHMGSQGAGYYDPQGWVRQSAKLVSAPVQRTGSGDVLSVCMILSEGTGQTDQRLQRSNEVVANFMSGRIRLIPPLA